MGTNLGRYIFWGGVLGVSLPLLIILVLQYRSLLTLQETLPAARKERLVSCLTRMAAEVEEHYRQTARILDIPAAYLSQENALLEEGEALAGSRSELASHFRRSVPEARRFFIATTGARDQRSYAVVLFFDPETGAFEREPGTRTWGAAHGASATWLVHSLTGTRTQSAPATVDERDLDNRIIARPILQDAQVIGVTGMILNERYFREVVLPAVIEGVREECFSGPQEELVVTAYDGSRARVLGQEPGRRTVEQFSAPLKFVFTDWTLQIAIPEPAGMRWAQLLSTANLSLSALMAILLVAGVMVVLGAASRAVKLSQMKADFVSNVSHELRTPLASIRVFAEFLRLGRVKDAAQVQQYGLYIERESHRLTQLIDNILDFSRIESGGKAYQFEEVDIRGLVSETVQAFRPHAEQSGFELELELPGEALPPLHVDSAALGQAVTNLLDNAMKYSGESKTISVVLRREGNSAALSVTDRGVGIPGSEQSRIFEKFYRVGTGLVHDVKGSGLGLSIVQHVIEAHGGRVSVRSRPGAGSTFTIFLPLTNPSDSSGQA